MYLARHQVGHQTAHWFAVTVRANCVFAERKVVCIVNVGFPPVPWPSPALAVAEGSASVTILFVSKPWGWVLSTEHSFFSQMEWAQSSDVLDFFFTRCRLNGFIVLSVTMTPNWSGIKHVWNSQIFHVRSLNWCRLQPSQVHARSVINADHDIHEHLKCLRPIFFFCCLLTDTLVMSCTEWNPFSCADLEGHQAT